MSFFNTIDNIYVKLSVEVSSVTKWRFWEALSWEGPPQGLGPTFYCIAIWVGELTCSSLFLGFNIYLCCVPFRQSPCTKYSIASPL